MKHFKKIPKRGLRFTPVEAFLEWQISGNLKRFTICLLLLLLGSCYLDLLAQGGCTLVCNGTQDSPLQLAVDNSCESTLVPDAILESPQSCPGEKQISVRNAMNQLVADGVDIVTFESGSYIEDTLSVTITDVSTGIFCVGFVVVVDNIDPVVVDCNNEVISCYGDTSVTVVGIPDITDNCGTNLALTYEDEWLDGDCLSDYSATVNRSWTATDGNGNTATCVQSIFLERPSLDSIDFPADVNLTCADPSADPVITGEPSIAGIVVQNGNICDLTVSFTNDTTVICGAEYQIIRTWTITNTCSGEMISDPQIITIQDEVAPQMTCPDDIVVATTPGQCNTTVNLPAPDISDNCGGDPDLIVSTSYGAVGLGPHPFVPAGVHTIQYNAVDACDNSTICTVQLTVEDDEAPVAVCEDFLIVSIPSGGVGAVNAYSFDDGSNDNCVDTVYFKVRRNVTGSCAGANGDDSNIAGYQEWYDDEVYFCCNETGTDSIMVTLRVYEIDPGEGPVDPARELPGGDLHGHFTDCMTFVEVQDKLAPVLNCPDNVTVDCDSDYSDLSIFGSPAISDNCSNFILDSVETLNISDCGIGEITRVFTAVDSAGNDGSCVQLITVVNNDPFGLDDIQWPQNYTTSICGASTDPDDLPEGFDEPVILSQSCGIISYNYDENFFDISFPACYKILRTWKVLDWCVYDPDDPNSEGLFTKTQVIKVQDNNDPVLTCPDDITVGVSSNCNTANVSLPIVTADDCSEDVLITNDSDYADAGGADASGVYPLGATVVKFSASDRCGNVSTCEVTITVQDNTSPAPVCIVGLSVNLADVDGEAEAIVDADAFDGGSIDNCTPTGNIVRTIRVSDPDASGPPSTEEILFSCDDLGTKLVEFWTTDEMGNSDYCLTYISIQDNNELCPFTATTGMIAGDIYTEEGENVENVTININNGDPFQALTGDNGYFEFPAIPMGHDYTVVPHSDADPLNGVSTIDLILISKHILGVQVLDSPYKIIAADIDRSGSITTLDVIKLRKLILNIDSEFPNGNKSWRFVRTDYTFPDPTNPFLGYFPELYNINDFDETELYTNFVAIKVGDVNNTAIPNNLIGIEARTTFGNMILRLYDQEVRQGEKILVNFTAKDMNKIMGYQFTLEFEKESLAFLEMKPGDLPDVDESNFNLLTLEEGMITSSWNEMAELGEDEETVLFSLEFQVLQDADMKDLFRVSSRMTRSEAYSREGDIMGIDLQVLDLEGNAANGDSYELYQNRPNPFRDQTSIGFYLPGRGEVSLTISDVAGKILYTRNDVFEEGYNEIIIKRSDLLTTGIVYYELTSNTFKDTKKMIITD